MTTIDSTSETLDCDGLAEIAPEMNVADAFRLSLRDETGKPLWRWDSDTVRAFVAECEEAELAERTNRPHWVTEGEWDDDEIVYKRDMANKMARIDRTLKRHEGGWAFTAPASMYLTTLAINADYDVDGARVLSEDLFEAIAILEREATTAPAASVEEGNV